MFNVGDESWGNEMGDEQKNKFGPIVEQYFWFKKYKENDYLFLIITLYY